MLGTTSSCFPGFDTSSTMIWCGWDRLISKPHVNDLVYTCMYTTNLAHLPRPQLALLLLLLLLVVPVVVAAAPNGGHDFMVPRWVRDVFDNNLFVIGGSSRRFR